MTANSSSKISQKLNLGRLKGKEIIANFEGGKITSDAGIMLMAELDKKLKITKMFAECFEDYINLSYVDYSVHQLVSQRFYGLILGYEDVNDHDKLRNDPALAIALEKLNCLELKEEFLAEKSTINRLEYCPETILKQEKSRYHRIEHDPKKIEKLFVDIFLQSYKKPPSQIILDMDVTDDQVHGNQEGAFFNTYYKGVCNAPLYIFCGHHLLVAKLRSSNVDPADGALEELQRVIKLIRKEWLTTQILVRADSAYAREEIFKFCEKERGVDYAIAMATNSQLKLRASDIIAKATVGTIRLNFLKLGARITVSVRRILIAIASACPYQDILAIAYSRIEAIQDTG